MAEKEDSCFGDNEEIHGNAVLRITCYDNRSNIELLARKSNINSRRAYFLAELATQALRNEVPPELRIQLFNLMLKRLTEQEKEIMKEELIEFKAYLKEEGYAD